MFLFNDLGEFNGKTVSRISPLANPSHIVRTYDTIKKRFVNRIPFLSSLQLLSRLCMARVLYTLRSSALYYTFKSLLLLTTSMCACGTCST